MIDSNLISLINLKESSDLLDVYSNKFIYNLYEFFYIINQHQPNYIILEFVCKIVYFTQYFFISITWIPLKIVHIDKFINIMNNIKSYIYYHDMILNKTQYILSLVVCFVYIIIIFILILIIIKNKKKPNITLIKFFNYMNLFYINYFYIFHINAMLSITYCKNSIMKFIEINCYQIKHILLIIIGFIFFVISTVYLFFLTKYTGTIANISSMNIYSTINSNYYFYSNIFCVISNIIGFFVFEYGENNMTIRLVGRINIIIDCFIILFYYLKKVYFYNDIMNMIILCGWIFSMWFTLSLFIKEVLGFKQLFFFIMIGWFLLGTIIYLNLKSQKENSLTNLHILHSSCLKDVEMFNDNIYKLLNHENEKNNILLTGIVNSFKEYFNYDLTLNEIYEQFSNNKYLVQKYKHEKIIFEIYSIIYTLLHSMIDKIKYDSVLILCAFLIKKLKNYNLAMYYCSKHKLKGLYNNFIKYSLIEDSKTLILKKLEESNLDNINKIEIGNVILYYKLIEDLKLKIYDAAYNQIDYFDILRNNILKNVVPEFFRIGNTILNLKNDILSIWDHLISLNPFNEEIINDYNLYLTNIIQDGDLYHKEEAKLLRLKNMKLYQIDRIYYTLFDYEISSIILIDGYSIKGKIIYVTSNFINLYNYLSRDIINLNINDLIPNCISIFHQEIYDEGLKYSDLRRIFKKEKDILLKGKNNELYNIKGFFKLLPDLSIGAIYIGLLQKIKDKDLLILLDKELKIDSMTIPFYSYELNNNIYNRENYPFGLNHHIIGYNISIIIPNILKLIKIDSDNLYIKKVNIDFKGLLYPISNQVYYFEKKINSYINFLKDNNKKKNKLEKKHSSPKNINDQHLIKDKNDNKNYIDLINEYNRNCNNLFYHISYKITKHIFLNNKYIYYRIYINRDIFSEFEMQEKSNLIQNQNFSIRIQTIDNELKLNEENKKILLQELKNHNKDEQNSESYKIEEKEPLTISKKSNKSKKSNNYIYFQDMRLKLFNNIVPNLITIIKIICLIFTILTIILIIINNNLIKNKIQIIENYLYQNIIFNNTKIILFFIYFSAIDLKMLKYNIIGNQTCIKENFCLHNFDELLNMEIYHLKQNTDYFLKLDKDYQELIKNEYQIKIYGNNSDDFILYNCQLNDILFLIFSFTQKINTEMNNYIFEDSEYIEIYIDSIIKYSIYYLNLNESKGFNNTEKKIKIKNSRFLIPNYYLIINWLLFLIIFGIIFKFVIKIYRIESNLILRIIRFQKDGFEKYIKYLEELKKKLKKDKIDENKNFNDENLFENESENENKNKDKKLEKEKNNLEEKKEEEIIKEKGKKQKKTISKISKLNIQKQEKIKIMKNYFFIENTMFLFKICILPIIVLSYYIIIYLFFDYKKKDFLKFDDFVSSILEIYLTTLSSFLKIKNQTINFTNFILEKNKQLISLNTYYESVTFNNEIFTQENYTLLENAKYYFEIPKEEELTIKKLNNLIVSYSSKTDLTKNNSKSILVKLYNGNACDILFHLFYKNETKYDICLKFWSSFLIQGIDQSLTQLEIAINHIIDLFKEINNSSEVLSNLKKIENTYSYCDDFILNYLYFSFRETFFILLDFEKEKKNNSTFKIIEFIFFFGCALLFFSFFIFIYYFYIKFKYFMNFILIFPLEYLMEEENLYKEIIKLHKILY